MDQLLGDIRSGFPERRLGDIYRRSKSRPDQDDMGFDSKHKSQAAMKRHSDPAMFTKVDSMNKSDEKLNVKSRRARFLDEANGDEIIGFLQNPTEAEIREGRSFGSTDDFFLERLSARRSGRRKRGDILNGEVQTRERVGSSPPPVTLPAPEEEESEDSAKLKLKSKINDWMLQNEKEQKRDRDLQLKLLKRQQISGQILATGDGVDDVVLRKRSVEELHGCKNDRNSDFTRITRSSLSRQSDNFTQKIISLLDAASSSTKTFERSKLYHSTREIGSKKHELVNKSKDDTEINNSNEKENTHIDNKEMSTQSNSDPESNKDSMKTLHSIGNFDRFASTRKTQRRLKLREMRIEAENTSIKLPADGSLEGKMCSDSNSVSNYSEQTQELKLNSCDNSANFVENNQVSDNTDSQTESNDKPEIVKDGSISPVVSTVSPEPSHTSISRNRSTSLRSRQSRLARRIDSLSTPVTSPVDDNKNILDGKTIDETPEIIKSDVNNETQRSIPSSSQGNDSVDKSNDGAKGKVLGSETPKDNTVDGNPTANKSQESVKKDKKATKMNGHISHKVTVSTESRDFSVPKSTIPQTQSTTSNSNKKQTISSSVIKTTQNVKVQQTIQRPKSKLTAVSNGKVNKTSKLSTNIPSPMSSPSVSKKAVTGNKDTKSKLILNGNVDSCKKESLSQSSSVSSICSMSTNVKLVKDQQGQNKNLSRPVSGDKITINHNGSIRFIKDKRDFKKAAPKVSTNTCITSKGTVEKKDRNSSIRKKL